MKSIRTASSGTRGSRQSDGSYGHSSEIAEKPKPQEGSKEEKLFSTVRVEDPDPGKEINERNVTFAGVSENAFLRDLLSGSFLR